MKKLFTKTSLPIITASLTAVLALASATGFADVRLGTPLVGGKSCRAGSVSVALTPDQSAMTILFDEASIEVPADARNNEAFGMCNLLVPIELGPGQKLKFTKWDYRGFYSIGDRSQANLMIRNRYMVQGENWTSLPTHTRVARSQSNTFRGRANLTEDFFVESTVPTAGLPNGCGEDLLLAVDLDMRLFRGDQSQAIISLDSSEGTFGATYQMQIERCAGGDQRPAVAGELFECAVDNSGMNRGRVGRCDTGGRIAELHLVQSNGRCAGGSRGNPTQFFAAEGNTIVVRQGCVGTFKVLR